jgi:predicted transcriptional regulator
MADAAPTFQMDYIEQTVDVVAAYVSNNSLPSAELPALIASIHDALNAIGSGPVAATDESVERPTPGQIRKSIRPDGLISFIDGKSYKTLKRHLTKHGLDPQSYRERYGLPSDYPTTSANYSAQRSALAKSPAVRSRAARSRTWRRPRRRRRAVGGADRPRARAAAPAGRSRPPEGAAPARARLSGSGRASRGAPPPAAGRRVAGGRADRDPRSPPALDRSRRSAAPNPSTGDGLRTARRSARWHPAGSCRRRAPGAGPAWS